MTLDAMTTALKKLITRGKERGYVTLDDLNAALPAEQVSSEMIEDTMAMLGDIGINVVERGDPEDGEAALAGPRKPLSPLPLPGAEAPLDGSQVWCSDVTSPT
jgi:RNA polymerase primary sigma factor